MSYARKGNKNPRVPILKLSTGGTSPLENKQLACKIVLSPPSVTIRSIFGAVGDGSMG